MKRKKKRCSKVLITASSKTLVSLQILLIYDKLDIIRCNCLENEDVVERRSSSMDKLNGNEPVVNRNPESFYDGGSWFIDLYKYWIMN